MLLHGLVEAARVNVDAGNEGIRVFELARVYLPADGQLPVHPEGADELLIERVRGGRMREIDL